MISVVQRVSRARVTIESEQHDAVIGRGLCVLLGVEQGDGETESRWMAGKLARLRIFPDDKLNMNRSVQDIGGEVLLVSQFTLAGDCDRGNRPSFASAAAPADGRRCYDLVGNLLASEHSIPVKLGVFGAMMQVELVNDGPVTLIVCRRPSGRRS